MLASLSLGVIALMAVALVSGVFALTRGRTAEQELKLQRQAAITILPATSHDKNPIADSVSILAPAWLGSEHPVVLRRARMDGHASVLVLEAIANTGHGDPTRLLVGVDSEGRITGVQLMARQETPGPGDAMDAAISAWIGGLHGRTLADLAHMDGKTRRDGDLQNQHASALRKQHAALQAVRTMLEFVARHGEEIRLAKSGATLAFNDAPDPATGE